jgi:membrane protease YdiL (CAAX protease family)
VAVIVGVLYPGYAILTGANVVKTLTKFPKKKIGIYRETAVYLIILSFLSLLPFLMKGESLSILGMDFISNPTIIIALFGIPFLALWFISRLSISLKEAKQMTEQQVRVLFLFPTNKREYNHTVFVSFVAGICEEIIYRGFLLWFFTNYMPLIPAIILANLPFALAHLTTTGLRNTIGTFILGLIFTAAFLLTGSLWLSILLHILMDLFITTVAYKSFKLLDLSI